VYPVDKKEVRKYKVKFSTYYQSPAPNTNQKGMCLINYVDYYKSLDGVE
jgi:hypothetical protein